MNRTIAHCGLFAALSAAFIGCGGPSTESTANRSEQKKSEWRRKRVQAEERFAEIAARLPRAQGERLHEELRREFDQGDRELESSLR